MRRIRSQVEALGTGVRANAARLTAATALVAVLLGLGLFVAEMHRPADWLWAATTAMLLVPLTFSVLRSLLRRDVGVDAIALFSMAGALALGEYLAGAVVALMLAGGNALEESANRRARRDVDRAGGAGPSLGAAAPWRCTGRGTGRGGRVR